MIRSTICGRTRGATILFALAVVPIAGVTAQEVGRFVYVEGTVTLTRDGERLEGARVAPGVAVHQFDVIETGTDGLAEVELVATGSAVLRVRENTSYYVEVREQTGTTRETSVRLLNGSVRTSVEGLAEPERLRIRTQSAVLGVRGTDFDVIVAADETVLVGVRDGLVVVDAAGEVVSAGPGNAVEAGRDGDITLNDVGTGALEAYYAEWEALRLELFRSGAATFVLAYARRYRETLPTFSEAYRELMRFREELRTAAESEESNLGADMRIRTAVSPALIRMRSILPLFETTIYRLAELERFHARGIGRTEIDGTSSREFFDEFRRRRPAISLQLSRVRTMLVLYGEIEARSFGGLPGGESIFGGDQPRPGGLLESLRE